MNLEKSNKMKPSRKADKLIFNHELVKVEVLKFDSNKFISILIVSKINTFNLIIIK